MTDGHGLGRLLPRHNAHAALEIEWNVRPARRRFNRGREVSVPGVVHDISLEGALIELPEGEEQPIDADVHIRVLGTDGRGTVRHTREAPSEGGALYGIQFSGDARFQRAINDAVTAFRENNAGLRARWEDSR